MPIQQLFIYLLVYIIPALALFGMACMVISKNYKRTENQLVALLAYCFSALFFEEFIRHLLPLYYSPILIRFVVFHAVLLIYAVLFHFYIHITNMKDRVKIPLYPFIFYIQVLFVIVIEFVLRNHIELAFVQSGIWMSPIMGSTHYVLMIVSSILLLILCAILLSGLKHAVSVIKYRLIRLLAMGTFLAFVLNVALGFLGSNRTIPPFPALLISLLLTTFLSISVYRFQLLPSAAKRYQTMFHLSPLSIIVLNEDLFILEFNKVAEKNILLYGHTHSKLTELAKTPLNKQAMNQLFERLKKEKELHDYPISFEEIKSAGILHYAIDASIVVIEDKILFYTIWRDVTEELEKERLIEHMAYRDGLTGLHNRAYFVGEIKKRLVTKLTVSNKKSAVVLLDLNRFKLINDTYGHAIGDDVLRQTASILSASVRENDLLARIGGDEFVLFLDEFPSEEAIYEWKSRLRDNFKHQLFKADLITIQIEISIGIAFFPSDGENFEELFQCADLKMYEDKLLSRRKIEKV